VKTIHFADKLSLPLDAVTQTFAFLARRGAGKTYGATKLAEGMLDAGAQVVAIDPVGVWWGLRLAGDGKGKGIDIPVLGGLHGDIPLEPGAGALVADLVADRGASMVLDVSMFRKGDRKRFVTDFAEQLFHRKKEKRSPVHVFLEEAQVFVPQRAMGDEARMLGAFEDLVKLGRNFGIGVTLISQRPQAVNKDALNQTECLVVLQTNGAQERKAIREWIVEQSLDVEDLVDTLPGLKRGEAWVWSPSWLSETVRVHISKKRTFNASATPEVGAKLVEPKELEPVDLQELQVAMEDVVAKATAEDPKALRRRVLELEAQLAKAGGTRVEEKRVEVSVLKAEHVARLEKAVARFSEALEHVRPVATELVGLVRSAKTPTPRLAPVHAAPKVERMRPVTVTTERTGSLPKGARDMLTALASTLRPTLSRNQVATLAGLKVTGGTFAKYLSILRTGGLVEDRAGELAITEPGLAAVGGRSAPASTEELLSQWKAKLPGASRDMLDVVVAAHPRGITREELGQRLNLETSGGTFAKYLSLLRSNGLVESNGGELMASEALFLGSAA
jgi:hypothetical protein